MFPHTLHSVLVAGLQIPAIAVLLALFFLPAIIADRRKRSDALAIALFNVCLGWTVIGWFAALFWAAQREHVLQLQPARISEGARIKQQIERRIARGIRPW